MYNRDTYKYSKLQHITQYIFHKIESKNSNNKD